MASNIFGSFDVAQGVTVNSTQEVLGKKRFLNPENEFEGIFVQPSIQANNTTISPTELSYLDGVTSNIQTQLGNFLTVAQADTNYLGRLGTPTSLASVTTFNGTIVSGDINGAALGAINGGLATTGNLVFGKGNLTALQTGAIQNYIFGSNSLALATTANSNIAIGVDCLRDTTTGAYNNALGIRTAQRITTGNANNAYGSGALSRTTTGSFNVGIGNRAGEYNVTGGYNAYFGAGAGANSGSVDYCTAVGMDAGKNSSGSNNTYIGAGSEVTGGVSNSTVIGAGATTAIANTVQLGGNTQNVNCPNTLSVASTSNFGGTLSITDGVNTNNVTAAGYTTKNSVQNATHFLNFSDSSATGTGAIQKNASLSCNPSTGTISCTTLNAALNITDTSTDANYYPVFVSGSGGQTLNADVTTGPFVINPSTGVMTFSNTIKLLPSKTAIGLNAGLTNQGENSFSFGTSAGNLNQGASCVAIGLNAGQSNQQTQSIAIGENAGLLTQGTLSVAIGYNASSSAVTPQGASSVSVGSNAGVAQGSSSVAIGASAGVTSQGNNSVAIGASAGATQAGNNVAIGNLAGTSQGLSSVAVGRASGQSSGDNTVSIGASAGQQAQISGAVAIGLQAGRYNQKQDAVAIGRGAGQGITGGAVFQGTSAVAIGVFAGAGTAMAGGQGNAAVAVGASAGEGGQGAGAVAIGFQAGAGISTGQGANAIAIGYHAALNSQTPGSICLNASGVALNPNQAGLFVRPVRSIAPTPTWKAMVYNPTTYEVAYSNPYEDYFVYLSGNSNVTLAVPLSRYYICTFGAIVQVTLPLATSAAGAVMTFKKRSGVSAITFVQDGGGSVFIQIASMTLLASASLPGGNFCTTIICDGATYYQTDLN